MSKTPDKKSPAADGAVPYRKRGNPFTDYLDAAIPLEQKGLAEEDT